MRLTLRQPHGQRSLGYATRGRRLLLLLLVSLCPACVGSHMAPMLQVPMFTRAGQSEAGLSFRPSSPRSEMGGVVRVAATDQLRLGASVSGATRRRSGGFGGDARRYPTLLAEGFLGVEWSTLLFRFGALAGSGYGHSEFTTRSCVEGRTVSPCSREPHVSARTRYVRSYGQLHFGLAPPGLFAASLAVRVPFVVDLEDAPSREADVSTEVGFTHSLLLRHLRFDLQPMWSRAQGFALHLALLLRLQPSRR
jgi:hypothetical protein